jgi:hypothetical protein
VNLLNVIPEFTKGILPSQRKIERVEIQITFSNIHFVVSCFIRKLKINYPYVKYWQFKETVSPHPS